MFFSHQEYAPFSELWSFEKIRMKACQQNVSKNIEARALKPGK